MGSQPRQQHGVPSCLLRRFTDESGKLWWASREWTAGNVLKGRPETIFRKRDLNARIMCNGRRDQEIELKLASWDAKIDRITGKLVSQGHVRKRPCLSASEKRELDDYLFVQYKRTHEYLTSEDEDQLFEDLNAVEPSDGSSSSRGERKRPVGQTDRDSPNGIVQNDKASSVLIEDENVSRVLRGKGSLLCRAPKGEAFVIGSKGVITAGSGEGALHEDQRGLVFPLASDILLYVGLNRGDRIVCDLSIEEVRYINADTARDCNAIAGRDPTLVSSALFPV